MRTLVLTLGILCGALAIPAWTDATGKVSTPAIGAFAVLDASATAAQDKVPQINVEVNRGGGRWYANPVWMAIGGIALLLVIILIVMAARGGGGGTTIVRG